MKKMLTYFILDSIRATLKREIFYSELRAFSVHFLENYVPCVIKWITYNE